MHRQFYVFIKKVHIVLITPDKRSITINSCRPFGYIKVRRILKCYLRHAIDAVT